MKHPCRETTRLIASVCVCVLCIALWLGNVSSLMPHLNSYFKKEINFETMKENITNEFKSDRLWRKYDFVNLYGLFMKLGGKREINESVILNNGSEFVGCNQENAAFPAGLCAERTALFAAGAEYPDEPVKILAIAARGTDGQLTDEPVSPCGTCRQVIIETETRHRQPVVILLYGRRCVYRLEGIRQLMPLSFTEF